MKHPSRVTLGILVASVLVSVQCRAQQPATNADLQKQVDALKAQVASLQKDLDDIKELLAPLRAMQPPKPSSIALNLGTRPTLGDPAAKLVLVEFTDYQ